jgi:CRP/FNR family transcriptional regulator
VTIELQAAWPCRDCAVRSFSFCGTLIDGSPSCPQSEQNKISQVFLRAGKDEVIRHNGHGGTNFSGPMVLCEGWANRFYRFADGRRQILSVLIPGDFFSVSTLLESRSDFSVQAATDVKICQLGRDDIKRKLAAEPDVCDAFEKLCSAEIEKSTSTAIDLNESDAATRVLGFVRRSVKRLSARGMAIRTGVYQFPLSHADIADATGLILDEATHAIQKLRAQCIVDISRDVLTILNEEKIEPAR